MIVVGLPVAVGVFTFRQPVSSASGPLPEENLGAAAAPAPAASIIDVKAPDPIWTRPGWADAVDGMVAFELPAAADVRLANGRLRPTLGISCANGRTDVHVGTGGSALIDPVTSGHIVKLTFDGVSAWTIEQQWVASVDQRNLLAPKPVELVRRLAAARSLSLTFTHYMTGSEVLDFDLRGADKVVASMAEPCAWPADEG